MSKTEARICTMLLRVATLAQRTAADMLFEMGVTPFEQWLLEAIPPDGDATASELAAELEVPTSTVTRALRRLERYEYVTLRKGVFYDGRVLRAQVTAKGAGIRQDAKGFEAEIDQMLIEELPPQSVAVLMHALGVMHRRLTRELNRYTRESA